MGGRGGSSQISKANNYYEGGNNPRQIGGDDSYAWQFEDEKRAVFAQETGYTGQKAIDAYDMLKHYMGGTRGDRAKISNAKMDEVIDDMVKYEGTAYRGIALTNGQLAKYTEGAVISLKNVSSWSSKQSVADEWAGASVYNNEGKTPNKVVLVMPKASKGARAGYMSIHGEAEVLYKSTQKIRVKKKTQNNGITYIEVEEA